MGDDQVLHEPQVRRFRTIFISDLHLGTKGAKADLVLDFLRWHDADRLYLVGDVIDGWRLNKAWHWPQSHNDVIQNLLARGQRRGDIIYLPGNHDEFMRDYLGHALGGIAIVDDTIHEAADGRRYLVIHGDQFDVVVRRAPWLAHLGDVAYRAAMRLNGAINLVRRRLGLSYWSLSAWAKAKVKNAVNNAGRFETTLRDEAARRQVDGVICGHIHRATITEAAGTRYLNCGDWVESCTALVEHQDGRFEILHWTQPRGEISPPPADLAVPEPLWLTALHRNRQILGS
jgi:UDP-2,3-diacylglucosamine pyrophosphatase LpxH